VLVAERFGAPTKIRLSELSIFNLPPEPKRIMAVLKGYFDDSQTTDRIWSIAGYVGDDPHWAEYEAMWPLVLATHDVPYFHRKEMSKPNGQFKKWYPAQEHETELAAFQGDLAKVIGRSGLKAFGSIVRIKDLNRFNAESGLRLDPYSLAAYGCMLIVGKDYLGHSVELIFDHVEKVDSKLAKARDYADADHYWSQDGVFEKVIIVGLPKKVTFKEVTAIQAADFWAWEWRKHQLKMDEWHEIEGKPSDFDQRWAHMQGWFRTKPVIMRESARALLESSSFNGIIWDYQQMCDAHQARDGVWALTTQDALE
jgi:hypothetical protein